MAEKIIEHSSKQMYIEDMVKYSIMVDRRRAFPEIKDGLKPVQRKVIFDMLELGATSYNNRIKSARTVGDTMGKYHPHGIASAVALVSEVFFHNSLIMQLRIFVILHPDIQVIIASIVNNKEFSEFDIAKLVSVYHIAYADLWYM